MKDSNKREDLPQAAIDYIDDVIKQKIDDGLTPEQAKQSTIEWLQGLGEYLARHKT